MKADSRLFQLITAGLLIRVLLSGYITDDLFSYSSRGGSPVFKIHPGSYLLIGIFAVLAAARGPVAFIMARARAEPWVFQFFLATLLIAFYQLAKFGASGLAYMIDALVIPPLFLMLLQFISPQQRLSLTSLIFNIIFVNSLIAIAEFVLKVHFLPAGPLEGADYFRSTALLGHPLTNALITAPMLPLLFLMNWSINRKLIYAFIFIISILAYGARGGLAIGVGIFAIGMMVSGGGLVLQRKLRLTTYLIIIFVGIVVGSGVIGGMLLGTDFGARIVQKAYMDDSAETRLLIFRIFDVLTFDQLWEGLPLAQVEMLQRKYDFFEYLENFWVIMLIGMGIPAFIVFTVSFIWYCVALQKSQHILITFSVISFIVLASTNNSLTTKTPALLVFSVAAYGLRRQGGRSTVKSVHNSAATMIRGYS